MSQTNTSNTIYLTPQEAERVRDTIKSNLQRCLDLEGQPREATDSAALIQAAKTASIMADFASTTLSDFGGGGGELEQKSSESMPAIGVGNPYPPCTLPVSELRAMELSELRMNTHHRGRILSVKRVGFVVELKASSWTVVQEGESGDAERLEVMLHKSRHGQDILDSATEFQIKEPYFTLNSEGLPTIRIDHPSDLVAVKPPLPETKDVLETATKIKNAGNAALGKQDFSLTHEKYSQALDLLTAHPSSENTTLIRDLHRNRALVNLSLAQYDAAKSDALTSLLSLSDEKSKTLDSKAYFRAACAAYHSGSYTDAKALFQKQLDLVPEDKDSKLWLRRTDLRLKEEETGSYDFRKLKSGLLAGRSPRIDVASFARNVKVGDSVGKGRGLFATRDMGVDEVILVEKAFCVVWGAEEEAALTAITYDSRDERIRLAPVGLSRGVVGKMLDNPSMVGKVLDLYGDYPGLVNGESQAPRDDEEALVDVFRVYDIVARNAFGPGPMYIRGKESTEDATKASAGLWVVAAYVNHSCVPNGRKESIGDLMILRATRKIKAGEEITHTYDSSSDYDARAAALMNTWGFACTCALCEVEKTEDAAVREKRRKLETEAVGLVEANDPATTKRITIVKAKRLAQSISSTYDQKRYEGLPRTALLRIQDWIDRCQARSIP